MALRPGLLAGSICGVLGVVVLIASGLTGAGTLPWVIALLAPLAAGAVAAWLLARRPAATGGPSPRRTDLVRAGALAGAASEVWLGLLLLVLTVLIVTSGAMEGQVRDLLAQNGLDASSAQTLSALVLACAGCFFLVIIPLIAAGLGALAAGAYSFARPAAPTTAG